MLSGEEAQRILEEAEQVCSAADVNTAVTRMALAVTEKLGRSHPLVLVVMSGAVVFAGQLLPQLSFPLTLDYLHVSRYGHDNAGGDLRWLEEPHVNIAGRTLLVVDDILDEGVTLAAIRKHLLEQGAAACYTAVFAEKDLGHEKPIAADFVGVTLPDRYLFGFGMDVSGAWRNLPAVYALKEVARPEGLDPPGGESGLGPLRDPKARAA